MSHQTSTTQPSLNQQMSGLPLRRWLWQRQVDKFRSTAAFRQWLVSLRPTPFGAIMLGLVVSFVISCVEQFAQSHALQEDTVRLRQEAERIRRSR